MLEDKNRDVEMGLLNDSTQNLEEAKSEVQNECEFNIYKEIRNSPRKFYARRFFFQALRISAWTCVMWALTTWVIGEPVAEDIVSVKTKHIKYNNTGVMFITGYNVYINFIRMIKQNMGIRQRCCGNCWAYIFIIIRIMSAVCAFFFLFPRLCIIYSRSFEIYDEDSNVYGVLTQHKNWYTAIISYIIWIGAVCSLLSLLLMMVFYLVFLRIWGFRQVKVHCQQFEHYVMRSTMEFILGS